MTKGSRASTGLFTKNFEFSAIPESRIPKSRVPEFLEKERKEEIVQESKMQENVFFKCIEILKTECGAHTPSFDIDLKSSKKIMILKNLVMKIQSVDQ